MRIERPRRALSWLFCSHCAIRTLRANIAIPLGSHDGKRRILVCAARTWQRCGSTLQAVVASCTVLPQATVQDSRIDLNRSLWRWIRFVVALYLARCRPMAILELTRFALVACWLPIVWVVCSRAADRCAWRTNWAEKTGATHRAITFAGHHMKTNVLVRAGGACQCCRRALSAPMACCAIVARGGTLLRLKCSRRARQTFCMAARACICPGTAWRRCGCTLSTRMARKACSAHRGGPRWRKWR